MMYLKSRQMDKINQVVKRLRESQESSWQDSSPASLPQTVATELSIYRGELTTQGIIRGVATIKKAFPALPLEFYDILTDRIRAAGFTDQRLQDAVHCVVDHCIFPQPTVAQFISYDQRIRVYTYEEMLVKGHQGLWDEDTYKAIQLRGMPKKVWIHVNDIAKYNIKSEDQ